jgi:hypothetical protein
LGLAIHDAEAVLSTQELPGEIVVATDLQASAISATAVTRPLLIIRPDGPAGRNLGVATIDPGPQPWSLAGGRVTVSVAGDSALAIPLSVRLGERPPRQALASVGIPTSASLSGPLAPPTAPPWRRRTC